jgi:tRNA pseudouridine32 synthase/23S rRNA pseudouridine746 synthase
MNLEIIYQDRYLVAVNKPAGLLSVPGRGEHKQDCVVSRLQAEIEDVRVVHRLDCHTSGIMLLAIGADMQRQLSRLFHDREIEKTYTALVDGEVGLSSGVIDIPLRADPYNRPMQVIDYVNGKYAQTYWRLLSHEPAIAGISTSRLQLRPITGRTHQLRVHCRALGHPVTGDALYNDRGNNDCDRMMLHAERLEFIHPLSGNEMRLLACCGF